MDPRLISSDVAVIGYGSLMSGLGLLAFGRLRVSAAARVAVANARRGFGKFSQHGDRFAMVLEPIRPDQPIEARTLAADAPPSGGAEGVGLWMRPNDLARLCDREGYSSGAIQRLRQEAAGRQQNVAALLWTLLEQAGFAIAPFRQRLFKLIGYTSPHYVPHPVRLDTDEYAITFLAPGREGSGSPTVVPVRVRTGNTELMSAPDVWQLKPNRTQLAYFTACLLGGLHGVGLQDLLAPLAPAAALSERLRAAIRTEQQQELARFLDMTGLDHTAYWQHFGPPTQSVRRSGLEGFMNGQGERRSAFSQRS